MGKTAWARSLGVHTYMNTYWSQNNLDEGCQYVVFDDIPFDTFKSYKAFLGK